MAALTEKKPTPEQLLQQLESDEEYQATARLKIFLGYASGVGKSFRMLDEGRRRHERGQDVVVGAIQPLLTAELAHTVSTLEIIPLKLVDERLSTVQAGRQLHDMGKNARKQRERIDSEAAAVFLQSYLDSEGTSTLPPLET